jgi:hypothetical protein
MIIMHHQEVIAHPLVLTGQQHLVHDISVPEPVARVFITRYMDNVLNPVRTIANDEDVANAR